MAITIKVTADRLAATQTVKDIVRDELLLYSEWLDSNQELMKKPKKNDYRTHSDLVDQFISER